MEKRPEFWATLLLYTLVALGGAAGFSGQGTIGIAWITLVMLVLVVACMLAGEWKVWQKVAFVPLAWR